MTLPVNAPEVVRPMIEWVPLEAGKRATLGDVAVQGRAGELQRQVPGARLVVAAEGVGAAAQGAGDGGGGGPAEVPAQPR